MRQKKFWFAMGGILAVLALALMLPTGAGAASNYKVLHRFKGKDGARPSDSLILDGAGNLYGTTNLGGAFALGTAFKLTPNSAEGWTESVLYSFCSVKNCADGWLPSANLVFDAAGNLYGTATLGGKLGGNCGTQGCGVVFSLKPNSVGGWTESVLYTFCSATNCADGKLPSTSLVFDALGNMYGITGLGGSLGFGVVFKLSPNSNGKWTESVIHSFNEADAYPNNGVVFDIAGNLYGTTQGTGFSSFGTVYTLKPNSDGSWSESVLYAFIGRDQNGLEPAAGVVLDTAGNLYGTTTIGGTFGYGVVFRLHPNSDGSWTYGKLHSFMGTAKSPYGSLLLDAAGNLEGTTISGGSVNGGVVFKMTNGTWAYSVLHVFLAAPAENPVAGLIVDKAGNLYGTTQNCGSGCKGVVYEITP